MIQHLTKVLFEKLNEFKLASIEALNYELKSDEEPLTKRDQKICCIKSGEMFCRLPQENTRSPVLFTSFIQKDRGNDRTFITPAPSPSIPLGKQSIHSKDPNLQVARNLVPWESLLCFQLQLSAMTFWLCHHGLSSKLLTFPSPLKTLFLSLLVQLLFYRCHEGCKDTHLPKGITQEQVAVVSSSAMGLPNDLGKVRLVP